ncbi:3-isopropylmalate dehydratase small subunit [bacterium]|nr:3-isopropylmalate dehydratase small subunit [bacterium]MBU1614590.1 3-isopropylmalate dehydratase small subunit [bacterium]
MIKGKVFKFGNDVNTDDIIPATYLDTTDPKELAKHCMENIAPEFIKEVGLGDIIVAGKNFGCGSSREHAPLAIKASGISAVVAISFARIFYRNSINIGLPILECGQAANIKEGHKLEIDLAKGIIKNLTKEEIYQTQPFPEFMQRIVSLGGLMEYVKGKTALQ